MKAYNAILQLLSLVLILIVTTPGYGADRYWVNGGITNNWTDATNWSETLNGPGGASVPAGDNVFFGGNGWDCNFNPQITIQKNITFLPDYTGTFFQGTKRLDVDTLTITGGTYNCGPNFLSINKGFIRTGGTFVPDGPVIFATVYCTGNFPIIGTTTFNHVNFSGLINTASFCSATFTITDTIKASSVSINREGPFFWNGGVIEVSGDFRNTSTQDSIKPASTTIFKFNGAGTQNIINRGQWNCELAPFPVVLIEKLPTDSLIIYGDTLGKALLWDYNSGIVDVRASHITTNMVVNSPISCNQMCDGSITVQVLGGGKLPYEYYWGPANYTHTATVCSGLWAVTVIDAANCFKADSILVPAPLPLTLTTTATDATCAGCTDGSITATASGGTPPYTFSINGSPFQVSNIFFNLSVGNYTVHVQDANGCLEQDVIIILNQCANFGPLTIITTDVFCVGCSDGTITVTASGGSPPYRFSIDNGVVFQSNNIFTGLSTGTYPIIAQDDNGCFLQDTISIANACANFSTTVQVEDARCFGDVNGKAWVTVSGGSVSYSWAWSAGTPSATGDTVYNLPTGTYSVTTSDVLGCHDTVSFTIGEPAQIQLSANITNTTCGSCTDGAIDLTLIGGVAPYTYTWGPPVFATTGNLSGLARGWYSLTLTDNNSCVANGTYIVDSTVCDFVSTAAKTDVSCFGTNDGKAWVTATGTSGPYNYIWSAGTVAGAGDTITNLVAGTYTVTTEDAVGCIQINHVTVLEPSAITTTTTHTDVTCFGSANGTASVSATGALTPVYIWSNGATTPSIGGCFPGLYTVTVVDGNGCSVVDTVNIQGPTLLQLTTNAVGATCPIGCADGTVTAIPTGGTPPYSFFWSTTPPQMGQTAIVLQPGTYSVTVTDVNGCTVTAIDTVGPFCNLTVSLGNDTAVCFGTYTIISTTANGAPPYSYNWSTSTASNSTLTVTAPGSYTLTITDNNNCLALDGVNITDISPTATAIGDTTICVGGAAQLSATGGTSYAWSPTAGLSDPTLATPLATPLSTTTYTVSVDNGTCASTRTVVVNVDTDCTWPGDANSDGIADNDDVLSIGIGYGGTGPLRPNASLVWIGQQSPNWMSWLASGVNYKHVDTNGDGTINADDTLAITQNYGLTHLKTEESNRAVNPTLYIEMPDTVLAGQTSYAHVYLGNDTAPVQNVYGIKFSITYDNTIVDTNTVHLNLDTCWLGTAGVDLLGFTKDLYTTSRVDIALTRINQTSISGGGPIGKVSFTMKDDVSGKNLLAIPMSLEILGERAIDELEQELTLTSGSKTIVVVQDTATGITNLTTPQVAVFPNPATDMLYIDAGQQPIQAIKLVNTLGQSIYNQVPSNSKQLSISTEGFARGVYLLYIATPQGSLAKRVVLY